jgi:hypothetical protein
MVMTTVIDLNIPAMNMMKNTENIKSKVITSLLNLVKILPVGFESKKTIFALSTCVIIFWCSFSMLPRISLKIIKALLKEARV